MEKISYKLEVFEGPLDLLLHLISKNKLDICDIPIAELLDQYMEHIRLMQEADIEVTSEFLTMASRLIYMKTAMLMPRHEEVDELKRELVGELMEYQLCRDMAQKLALRANFDQFAREETVLEVDRSYRLTHDISVLYEAYIAAAGRVRVSEEDRTTSNRKIGELVATPVVSVESRVDHVLKRLYMFETVGLQELFKDSESKSEAIATFLAVLELLKAKRIILDDASISLNYEYDGTVIEDAEAWDYSEKDPDEQTDTDE